VAHGRGENAIRATISLVVLLGLAACSSGPESSESSEDYPFVEEERPEVRETVTTSSGAIVSLPVLPTVHEVEPSRTCERTMASFHDGSQRPVVIPPAPGLKAVAVTKRTTRLEWSFDHLPDDCRPVSLLLAVNNDSSPRASPTTRQIDVDGVSGSVEIAYADFLPPPDVAHAAAYSDDGRSSRTTTVLVERSEDTPPDPSEPAPPLTAPAGKPVSCNGAQTEVADRVGDVLTHDVGKPPAKVRRLTPALAGIDVTRAAVQIDGSTICAAFTLARPPSGDFGLTLWLVDTTTFRCCAALGFRRSAGRLELGNFVRDAQGTHRLEPVADGGAKLRGDTLVISGTLPDDAWNQPRPPASDDVAWHLTTSYDGAKHGPYFTDWVPRHEPIGQPFIRHRDATTVRLGPPR